MLLVLTLSVLGCGPKRPGAIQPPAINPDKAGADAIALYDKNGDGAISGAELDATPALKASVSWVSKNGDGSIRASDIADRIKLWRSTKIGLTTPSIQVRYGGKPVPSGKITLTPEPFLGSTFLPATGTITNGSASVTCDPAKNPDNLPGMPVGFYTVTFEGVKNAPEKMGVEIFDQNPEYRKTSSYILELKVK